MNREDIEKQIAKFKARRLKSRLASYCTITSLLLTLSIFSRDISTATLSSFLLVLPLPLYFSLQSLKLHNKTKGIHARLSELKSTVDRLESKFSLKNFLTQPSFAFRLSLILFFLVVFTTLARIRTPEPASSITYSLSTTN